ncbi:MAG TPA: hypothetical protein VFK57_08900 [Vicinamibacterales bacterium]|nr:hypothetical protein [Vicinamibacterales bacterium]
MRRAALLQLLLAAAGLLLLPLLLRGANRLQAAPNLQPSYLPALEGPRERKPFEAYRIGELAALQPAWVVIGDSMAGSRIDPQRLSRLTGGLTAPLLYAGSSPAWWYLALKNWVIPSGIKPRAVIVFFRDTNLTNVMFRIDATWSLDTAALDREDELNAVVARRRGTAFYQVRDRIDRIYEASAARRWVEPAVNEWPARVLFRYRRPRAAFLDHVNERFGLAHLRPMDAADMQATEDREADFDRFVEDSTLPLMLRDARAAGLTLLLVRVQRRPIGGRPPQQSPALRRYIARLHAYVEARGGVFMDDTGDPAQTLDLYEDGDHLSRDGRRRYTEMFAVRLRQRFP